MQDSQLRKQRIQNALWGLFIGDALAMPVHWYYNPENIKKDFAGGDNVHRGMLLGLRIGAASDGVPDSLKSGLVDHANLAQEIDAFAELAVTAAAF